MMSVKLVFQNLKRNVRDYLIYFLTLVLAIAVYYAFNAVSSAEALKTLGEEMLTMIHELGSTITYLSYAISFLIGFLILYVNKFLLKRRKKELGIYMLLGMRKSKISAIFVGETFCIGLMSLVVGTLLGIFLGQILTVAALRVFGGEVNNFMLSFCPHAFVVTVVSFGIIYLLSMVLNVCIISGVKLIDLLNAERKNEELKKRSNVIYAIVFAVGLLALAGGALSLRTDELFPGRKQLACGFTLIAFATVCIFYSVSSVVLMLVKSNRKFYYRDINSFLVRQLGSRMQGNFLSMSAVCLLLTLTMVLVTAGVSIAITMSEQAGADTPYDFVVFYDTDEDRGEFITDLARSYEHSVDLDEIVETGYQFTDRNVKNLTYADIYGENAQLYALDKNLLHHEVCMMGISDFNELMKLQGRKPYSLAEDEFYFNCNYKGTRTHAEKFVNNCGDITINDMLLHPAEHALLSENFAMTSIGNNDRGTLIVSDAVAAKGIVSHYILEGFWKKGVDAVKANQTLDELTKYDLKDSPFSWNTRSRMRLMYYTAIGLPVFMCTYCGLIFLLISVALLAVQQLTEVNDNQKRYRILEKQGVPDAMMRGTIRKQVGVYFLAPFVLAFLFLLSSIGVVTGKASDFCNMEVGFHVVPVMIMVLIVYGGYYLATVWSCQRMVLGKK